jgi:hypothetical protein
LRCSCRIESMFVACMSLLGSMNALSGMMKPQRGGMGFPVRDCKGTFYTGEGLSALSCQLLTS